MTISSPPSFRLKRNGTVILTWTPPTLGILAGEVGGTTKSVGVASRTHIDSPGGAAVYTLEVNGPSGDIGGSSLFYRSLLVQGIRR